MRGRGGGEGGSDYIENNILSFIGQEGNTSDLTNVTNILDGTGYTLGSQGADVFHRLELLVSVLNLLLYVGFVHSLKMAPLAT